jgi:hypothetical protein
MSGIVVCGCCMHAALADIRSEMDLVLNISYK